MFFSFLLLESLDDGTSPPCYLVDGLKELVYSLDTNQKGEDGGGVLPEVWGI